MEANISRLDVLRASIRRMSNCGESVQVILKKLSVGGAKRRRGYCIWGPSSSLMEGGNVASQREVPGG